jgi:hypothetical protein
MRDIADAFLADVGKNVERCFDGVTLRDLCVRGEELGLRAASKATSSVPPRWVI